MDYTINFPNLGIYLDHVGKSIQLGNFSIAYYGICVACGMLAAITIASYIAKHTGINPDDIFDLGICDIIIGVSGARIYYVVFRWEYYKDNLLSIFNLREGGLAIYGGILFGILATVVFSHVKKLKFSQLADCAAFGLPLGQMIGRWGNFFNREAFGGYTNNLLAMQLPVSAVRSGEITAEQMEHIQIIDGIEYIQVHPTFLYEGLWNLGVLCVLFYFLKHRKFNGQLFLTYLLLYGVGRFWIEALRTDQLLLPVINYPVSRALAGFLVILSAVWIAVASGRAGKKEAETEKTDN